MKPQLTSVLLTASLTLSAPSVFAELLTEGYSDESLSNEELLSLSLEEVMTLEVTSVSRKKQRLMDSAAAVYVVTQEDIRRSGAKNIPDALRMVPGVQVAQMNSNTWSISTRGFNYIFANKLLVMMDGRTIYTPLFSGVNWDIQDTLIEDIDRIEVIRGPGAALWGANAVNGVINIITRKASDTHGNLLTLGAGSQEKLSGSFRNGGEFNDTADYRVYVKSFARDGRVDQTGGDANDDWHINRAGFRVDWDELKGGELTVHGAVYDGNTRPPVRALDTTTVRMEPITGHDRKQQGGNLLASWSGGVSDSSELSVKGYYDRYENSDYRLTEIRDTLDFEMQHRFQWLENQEIIWGLGYRSSWYDLSGRNVVEGADDKPREELVSAFIQDEIILNPDWHLTLSSRLEHHTSTGYEFQPNARIAWSIDEQSTAWASVSRAVRTPAITERDLEINGSVEVVHPLFPLPAFQRLVGNSEMESEALTSVEAGYRHQINHSVNIDTTVFLTNYQDLTSLSVSSDCPSAPSNIPGVGVVCPMGNYWLIPSQLINGLNAKTYGFEFSADWRVNRWWRIKADMSFLQVDATRKTNDQFNQVAEAQLESLSANHSANVRSMVDLPGHWSFDSWIRYMGERGDTDTGTQIDAYTALDIRLARKVNPNLEFSLTGKNLFDTARLEFTENYTGLIATEIEPSWYAQIQWNF